MKKSEIAFGLLRIPVDMIATVLAFVLGYKIRTLGLFPQLELPLDPTNFPTTAEHFQFALIASVGLVAIFAINQMYSLKITSRISREIGKVVILSAAWLMLIIGYFFFTRSFPFSRLALAYSWAFTVVLVATFRALIRFVQYKLLQAGVGRRRVAVVGESEFSKDITRAIIKNPRFKLVGFITDDDIVEHRPHFLGTVEMLAEIIKNNKIEEIIQAQTNLNKVKDAHIVQFCRESHIGYSFVPDLLEIQRTNIEVRNIGKIPIISLKPTPLDGWGRVWKRLVDIFGATAGLIISSPLLLISAIAIKLDSKGPVVFSQKDDGKPVQRVGEHGRLFTCYKLRTMHPGQHARRYEDLLANNLRKDSPLVKIQNDPRITRVGRYLRRLSIDEIPQFWNVLKGDMSLVGPRPHFPEEIAKYDHEDRFVLAIKPGITGLAQINGRSDLEFNKEVEFDTYYIQNWSPVLDVKIMIKTIGAVLKGYKE